MDLFSLLHRDIEDGSTCKKMELHVSVDRYEFAGKFDLRMLFRSLSYCSLGGCKKPPK